MKVCPYCRTDVPDDTVYCTHCGKPILEVKDRSQKEKETKKQRAQKQQVEHKQEEAQKNAWISIGVILFLVALVGFDGILGMLFNAMNMNYKMIFTISSFIYAGTIICGVMGIWKDYQSKKKGIPVNSNYPLAIAEIFISSYIILVNVQQILLG